MNIPKQKTMTTLEKMNKKFDSLNRKYVKLDKQMEQAAQRNEWTWDMEQQLEKISDEMMELDFENFEESY